MGLATCPEGTLSGSLLGEFGLMALCSTWKSESTEVCEGTWQEQGRLITVGLCWSQSLTL